MTENPKERQRRRWFDAGADAIAYTMRVELDGPAPERVYICPLCWLIFDEEALEPPPELTLEDVPPASVGGKPLVLTCRTCNNVAGSRVDADAATYNRQRKAIRGQGGRIELRIDNGITAELEVVDDGSLLVYIDSHRSDDSARMRLEQRLEAIADDDSGDAPPGGHHLFDAVVRWGYDPNDVKVSYLRAAYLVVFAFYGYRAVLAPAFRPLRVALRDLDHTAIPLVPILSTPEGPSRLLSLATHELLGEVIVVWMGDQAVVLPNPLGADESWWDLLPAATEGSPFGTYRTMPWPSSPVHYLDLLNPAPEDGEGQAATVFEDDEQLDDS